MIEEGRNNVKKERKKFDEGKREEEIKKLK